MTELKLCPFCGVELMRLRAGKTLVHPTTGCVLDDFQFSDDFIPEWEARNHSEKDISLMCQLVAEGAITLGRAAELMEKQYWEMEDEMKKRGLKWKV